LKDSHIEKIALSGGIISIAYFDQAICGTTVEHIVNAIMYVRDLVGIDHVGLGSGFDGIGIGTVAFGKKRILSLS
jgi:membrane dipeptidase